MNRTASAFLLVAVLTGLLVALGFALQIKGYGFGSLGNERLDGLAGAATFLPLAALYAFTAMLVTILPIRAAAMVHANGTTPIYLTAVVLFATIVGMQITRMAFGNAGSVMGTGRLAVRVRSRHRHGPFVARCTAAQCAFAHACFHWVRSCHPRLSLLDVPLLGPDPKPELRIAASMDRQEHIYKTVESGMNLSCFPRLTQT